MRDFQTEQEVRLRGCFEICLRNAQNDEVISKLKTENTVVTAGRRWVLEAIQSGNNASSQVIQAMAVGTGNTAPSTADAGLVAENTRKSIGTFTTSNLTSNPPSWRAECSFATNEANTTLGEVALFNSSAAGTMLCRATFPSTINKTTSNTLSISYTISN